jgi:hypothetical protein
MIPKSNDLYLKLSPTVIAIFSAKHEINKIENAQKKHQAPQKRKCLDKSWIKTG